MTTDKCKLIVCIELFRQQLCLGFRNPFTYAGVYYSSRLKEFWCSLSFCNLLKEFKLFMKLNDYFRPSGLFWVQTPWSWQELVGFVLRMSIKHANFKGISLEITYQASYNLLCLETFQRRPSVRQWTARECMTCFLKKNKKKNRRLSNLCYWRCLTYWCLFAFCNLRMKSVHNTTKTKTSLGNRVGIYNVIHVSLCLHLIRTCYRKTGTTQVPNSKVNETSMAVFYLDIVYAQSINLWA